MQARSLRHSVCILLSGVFSSYLLSFTLMKKLFRVFGWIVAIILGLLILIYAAIFALKYQSEQVEKEVSAFCNDIPTEITAVQLKQLATNNDFYFFELNPEISHPDVPSFSVMKRTMSRDSFNCTLWYENGKITKRETTGFND